MLEDEFLRLDKMILFRLYCQLCEAFRKFRRICYLYHITDLNGCVREELGFSGCNLLNTGLICLLVSGA